MAKYPGIAFFVLERPSEGTCEEPVGCNRDADIYCDMCGQPACPDHSYDWTYPSSRGYRHPPQKILCTLCESRFRKMPVEPGDTPGWTRLRSSNVWRSLATNDEVTGEEATKLRDS